MGRRRAGPGDLRHGSANSRPRRKGNRRLKRKCYLGVHNRGSGEISIPASVARGGPDNSSACNGCFTRSTIAIDSKSGEGGGIALLYEIQGCGTVSALDPLIVNLL